MDDGWKFGASNLRIVRDGLSWPNSNIRINSVASGDGQPQTVSGEISFLRLSDLMPLIKATVAVEVMEQVLPGNLQGDVEDLFFELIFCPTKILNTVRSSASLILVL